LATERAYWLAWSQIKGVGPVTIKHLWEHFETLEAAWQASSGALLSVDGIGILSADKIVAQRPTIAPERLLAEHERNNPSFWTPADPDYPALLFAINDPPPVLYYRGSLRLNELNALSVGIVGTRRPSSYGRRWTQRLSKRLTQEGAVIVSGLAAGIDTTAHESCLNVNGLTVAVLGTGVDRVYPAQNGRLQAAIEESGLVVSEYPDGTGPDKKHFPQRNRIIAGLSRAVLVTEAPVKSGSLITSRLANDYCREVYALPCGLDNAQGLGNLNLIAQGAQIILGEQPLMEALGELPPVNAVLPQKLAQHTSPDIDSLNNLLHSSARHSLRGDKSKALASGQVKKQTMEAVPIDLATIAIASIPDLSPMLSKVLEAVSVEPTVLDNVVQLAQMETGQVLGALVQLELLGLVTQLPGMHYQRG